MADRAGVAIHVNINVNDNLAPNVIVPGVAGF